jgi:hypothetical protein
VTRIVLNPPQMRGVASRLDAAAAELNGSAARLAGAPKPEMPPGIAGEVESTVSSVAQRIRHESTDLVHEARMLRVRAALAELGAAVAYALRGMNGRELDPKSLLRRLGENPQFESALAALASAEGLDELHQASNRWMRLLQFREARGAWDELVNPIVKQYGEGSYRALKQYLSWEELVSHWMPLEVAHDALNVRPGSPAELRLSEEAAEGGKAIRGLRLAGKAAAPLDIALSGTTVLHGSEYHGVRGDIDRAAAGASVVGSSLILAGAVAPIPVGGQVAAGVIVTGAGLWTAGNLAYDHRKEIARAAVAGAGWVDRHKWQIAAHVGGPVPGAAYEGGRWIVHHAPDVGKTLSKAAPWNW